MRASEAKSGTEMTGMKGIEGTTDTAAATVVAAAVAAEVAAEVAGIKRQRQTGLVCRVSTLPRFTDVPRVSVARHHAREEATAVVAAVVVVVMVVVAMCR